MTSQILSRPEPPASMHTGVALPQCNHDFSRPIFSEGADRHQWREGCCKCGPSLVDIERMKYGLEQRDPIGKPWPIIAVDDWMMSD